ncbi:MAG: arginine--tRNA ligase [Anaerolineae bacterium]|nr:arginine--tRNA ligase [Anaerolineae bacterium]MDH7475280.1 arginine--tRNA ligase [Anaerolineae bacterium]
MIKDELTRLIAQAIKKAQHKGDLPKFDIPEVVLEHPKQAEHGDYATPVCLQMARLARMAPVEIAKQVVKCLPQAEAIGQVEVAHPGYINITLSQHWLAQQVEDILDTGETWGNINLGQGRRVQVEYGSANPTGPLHIGFARNVVLGDGLANVLAAAGYDVQREYYVNDAGTQMDLFGETMYARYAQALGRDVPFPEGGYPGSYIEDWAAEIAAEEGDKYLHMPREEAVPLLRDLGLSKVLAHIRQDVESLGIRYDNWFSERTLYEEGHFERIMTILRQGDHLFTRDGAVWFAASRLGVDKDEVLIRSNGEPGYFASDIAYHYHKFVVRGFDWVIDVWGADHQGHVPRMRAMMQALGLDPKRLTLLLYQLVTLKRGGEVVRLSKRKGEIITLREIIEEVGPDAVRFFLLSRSADSQMDFDLDLAKEQSERNPVYYVQYAHARIASILRYAAEQGATAEGGDLSLLTHPSELALIRQMLLLPEIIEQAVLNLAPHHLTYYAQDLASAFHVFYRDCRVVSSDPADAEVSRARLKLARAAKTVLARTLHLMGMTAPESM